VPLLSRLKSALEKEVRMELANKKTASSVARHAVRELFAPISFSFPILGNTTVSSDAVDPSCEGYRLFTISRSNRGSGKTALEILKESIFN
jgi:hypothetical protein